MGINKDKNFDVKNSYTYNKYINEILPKETEHDIKLEESMIKEINSKGYYIQISSQLTYMDENDFDIINPILMKYSGKFDKQLINSGIYSYLGVKNNFKAVDFLINEFKKPNDINVKTEDVKWNFSRRGSCSSSLLNINDKSRYKEYIDIIDNQDTCDDCWFFIRLIGSIKNKDTYNCLKRVLKRNHFGNKIVAIKSLSNFKDNAKEIISLVEPYAESNDEVMKETANQTLKKLKQSMIYQKTFK